MTGHELVRAHAPRADLVRVEKNDERWSIWLDGNATVVELALLLGGIPCKLEAHDMGEGAFALIPVEAHAICPTADQVAALFQNGLADRLPSLRRIETPALVYWCGACARDVPAEHRDVCPGLATGG